MIMLFVGLAFGHQDMATDKTVTYTFTVQLDDGLQLTYGQDRGSMTFGDYNNSAFRIPHWRICVAPH